MRIDCTHCGKALQLPDEKVPAQAFALTCPACQQKFRVDPPSQPDPEDTRPAPPGSLESTPQTPPTQDEPDPEATAPVLPEPEAPPAIDVPDDGSLPRLREEERELLAGLSSLAVVANLDSGLAEDPDLETDLRKLGFTELRRSADLAQVCSGLGDLDVGLLLIRAAKTPSPTGDALKALEKLPYAVRRRTFVALATDGVRSLDGQLAFFLQVNCVLASDDRRKWPGLLTRALLHHVKLYRFWNIETV